MNVVKELVELFEDFMQGGHTEQYNAILPVLAQYDKAIKDGSSPVMFSREELATVLAALAHYQNTHQDVSFMRSAELEAIATDNGELEALMPVDVEDLRERLNLGEG